MPTETQRCTAEAITPDDLGPRCSGCLERTDPCDLQVVGLALLCPPCAVVATVEQIPQVGLATREELLAALNAEAVHMRVLDAELRRRGPAPTSCPRCNDRGRVADAPCPCRAGDAGRLHVVHEPRTLSAAALAIAAVCRPVQR